MGIPSSGAGTTGWAPVCVLPTKVRVGTSAAVAMGMTVPVDAQVMTMVVIWRGQCDSGSDAQVMMTAVVTHR